MAIFCDILHMWYYQTVKMFAILILQAAISEHGEISVDAMALNRPWNKLSKMVDNSTSYPMYSGYIRLSWATIDYWRNANIQLRIFILKKHWSKYIRMHY